MIKLILGLVPLLLFFKYVCPPVEDSSAIHKFREPRLAALLVKDNSNVQFTLNIITNDRPESLKRLLKSIERANYYNHTVNIRFSMDSDADKVTMDIVDKYAWNIGHKAVQKRIQKGGLMKAVAESWYPASDNDHAIFLEDDVEVSDTYFDWILFALDNYGTNESSLVGVSLYNPKFSEVSGEMIVIPPEAYLYQFPSSWGCLFFAKGWKEFNLYISSMIYDESKPYIPMSRTNNWQNSWKKYFVSYMYDHGKYMLYPPVSFSTNHVEPGTHYKTPSKFTLDRLRVGLYRGKYSIPPKKFSDLPVLNIYGTTLE